MTKTVWYFTTDTESGLCTTIYTDKTLAYSALWGWADEYASDDQVEKEQFEEFEQTLEKGSEEWCNEIYGYAQEAIEDSMDSFIIESQEITFQ